MRWIILPPAAAAAAMLATTVVAQQNPSTRWTVSLTGEEEVVPGDPDGTGTAIIRINTRANQLCYTLRVRGIEPATAAHIHEAPPGSAGAVVVELRAPTGGQSSGCVKMSNAELLEILAEPEDYYVNVHNEPYPGGALRAQLG